jgi:hypothetical protein
MIQAVFGDENTVQKKVTYGYLNFVGFFVTGLDISQSNH